MRYAVASTLIKMDIISAYTERPGTIYHFAFKKHGTRAEI